MTRGRARVRSLRRGLVGAAAVAGLALAPVLAPASSSDEAGASSAFGPAIAHADPAPTPSVRPTPTAPPSDAPTEAPEERKEETCPQDSPRYIKQEPIILDQVGVRRAWDISRGAGVTVAVVDSGVAAGNEHFNSGDPSVVLPGIDLSGEGTDGRVDVGEHGTAIAGAIAARQLPAAKGSGLIGVAPEAKILPVRIETGLEQGNTDKPGQEPFMSRVARAIRWAADNGAQIIVVAQSSKDPNSDLEAAVAAVRGRALVVASTGNTYQDQKDNEVVYPAAYEGVLAVTASDANGFASDQQVHGAHVDLAVPAAVIHTTWFDQADCLVGGYSGDTPLPSSSYATAYAGGFAALVASQFPNESPDMWKYRLEVTALRGASDQRTNELGWGIVAPYEALTFDDIGTRYGPPHPDQAGHPVPSRPAQVSPHLTSRDNIMTMRTYIVIGIVVLGAAALGGLVILSHLHGRPVAIERDDDEDTP